MAGFEGMDRFIKQIHEIPKKAEREGRIIVQDVAQGIVRDAVNNLRANGNTDTGGLMQSINALPQKGGLKFEVMVRKDFAPSIEFGTRGKVDFSDQPAELRSVLQQYAMQFKGTPTGTWDEFWREMIEWVKRKGLTGVYSVKTRKRLTAAKYDNDAEDEGLAWLIARSIYLHGIPARPFFFPAYHAGVVGYKKKLEALMQSLL